MSEFFFIIPEEVSQKEPQTRRGRAVRAVKDHALAAATVISAEATGVSLIVSTQMSIPLGVLTGTLYMAERGRVKRQNLRSFEEGVREGVNGVLKHNSPGEQNQQFDPTPIYTAPNGVQVLVGTSKNHIK